jgi:hypothetical protein
MYFLSGEKSFDTNTILNEYPVDGIFSELSLEVINQLLNGARNN